MKMRYIAPAFALMVTGVGLAASPQVALAHDANIEAEAVCDDEGQPVINFTSTSWEFTESGENAQVDIWFDGVVVFSGAYVLPDNAFSGSLPAPAGSGPGDTVDVVAIAVADWGNGNSGGESSIVTVTIPPDGCEEPNLENGRMTGGGHQMRMDQVRVTRGFTIHCDLLLSNNLEVNWTGNKFHMTEHLQTVECSDDPDIIQAPPPAPLDTLIGVGTGRYNGIDGYTIEFTLVDAGEPGTNDMAALRIYRPGDPDVLKVPLQNITGGNIQAHYDQPHR